MKRPLFSCVIPVKGARPYFDEALESLLSQGLGDDLEIIVQDGDEIGVEGSGRGRDCFSRKGRKDRKGRKELFNTEAQRHGDTEERSRTLRSEELRTGLCLSIM